MFPYPISFNTSAAGIPFSNTKSLAFDGVDDYLTVPSFTTSGDDLTISFWGKLPNLGAGSGYMLAGNGSNNIYYNSSEVMFAKVNGSTAYIVTNSLGVPNVFDSNWHHFAITKTGSTLTFWFDGSSFASSGSATTGGFTLTNIGSYITPSAYITGNLDEVAIWQSDQTSNMATIYGTGAPSSLASLNPVAWYRMGDNSSFKSPQILMPEDTNKDKVSNYSMAFDGVDDTVTTSASVTGGDFTLSYWVNANGSYVAFARSHPVSIQPSNNSANQSIGQIYCLGVGKLWASLQAYDSTDTTYSYYSARDLDFEGAGWHNIIWTFNNTNQNIYLYIDGVAQTFTNYGGTATTPFLIGRTGSGALTYSEITLGATWLPSEFWNGNVDEVATFNSILSSENITTISATPLNDITSLNPFAYWKLGEEATFVYSIPPDGIWTVPDSSVNSNDGTSANMTIEDREGNAPNSDTNALSYNMDAADVDTDVPS